MASMKEINDAIRDRETVILIRNGDEFRIIRKVLFRDKQWLDAVYFEAVDDPRCAYCAVIDNLEDYVIKDEPAHKFTQHVTKVPSTLNISSVTSNLGFVMCVAFVITQVIAFNQVDAGPEAAFSFQYVWVNAIGLMLLLFGASLKVRSEKFVLRLIKPEMKKVFEHDLKEFKDYLLKLRKVRRALRLSIWEAIRFKLTVRKTVSNIEEADFLKQIESKN